MKQQKLASMSSISMIFIATTVFLPGLVQSFYFPPAPEYQIDNIIHEVENLVTAGVLTEAQGSKLKKIVRESQKMILEKGNTTIACNLLQKFICQVRAYIDAETLSTTKGGFLIDSADDVITQLR